MKETGIITSIDNDIAQVKMLESDKCESCGLCSAGKNDYHIKAVDKIGVSVGDKVVVNIEPSTVLKFSFMVYIMPILVAILGYFLFFYAFNKKEGFGVVGSLIFLVVTFSIYYFRIDKEASTYECHIIEKL